MDSAGSISSGDITAASIDLLAGSNIDTGDLTTQSLLFLLFPGASVTLQAGGNITTGDISSFDGVYANAKTLEACREELEEVLEEWMLLRVSKNLPLSVVDGIELAIREVA